jgi:hypothetical protein
MSRPEVAIIRFSSKYLRVKLIYAAGRNMQFFCSSLRIHHLF